MGYFALTEDSFNGGNDSKLSFQGKIAVITNLPFQTQNDEEFWSGEQALAKYGQDSIIHVTWPVYFMQEKEQVDAIITTLSVNWELRALIINQAVPGCNAALEKLKKFRDDIFVVCCVPHESPSESARLANLIFRPNDFGIGSAVVKQAKRQGATTFVHYSFPRHMAMEIKEASRDIISETCAAEGIVFVDVKAMDPMGEPGGYSAEEFILEDVPRMVAKYGENTAFFCTCCFLQVSLIKAVMGSHAIFPQPCCPSPYHGFPEALGIEIGENQPDLNYIISETKRISAANNMTGRLSTWPAPLTMMFTNVGLEYAIKWINGEVPKKGIDDKVLLDCMRAYIKEVSGGDIDFSMTSYTGSDKTWDNFKLLLMNYFNY